MNDGCNIIVVDMEKSCQVLPDFTSGFPNQVVDTQPSPSLIHILIQCTLHTLVFYEEQLNNMVHIETCVVCQLLLNVRK